MTTALSACLYADLLGKPFVHGARGPEAFDCVGLVMECERRRGLAVPSFDSSSEELHRQLATGGYLASASPLPHAEPGCVVLLHSLGGPGFHVGMMVDSFYMLHASEPAGSVVLERLRTSRWARRIVGFYLLEGDA